MTKAVVISMLALIITAVSFVLSYVPWIGYGSSQSGSCRAIISSLGKSYYIYILDIENTFPPIEKLYEERIVIEKQRSLCFKKTRHFIIYYNIYGQEVKIERDYHPDDKTDFCYLYNESLPKTPNTIIIYCPLHIEDNYVPVLLRDGTTENMKWPVFNKIYEQQVNFLKQQGIKHSFKEGIISQKTQKQ